MTDSTGAKGEMHCSGGFLAIFGTIKHQDVRSFRGLRPLDHNQGPALDPLGGGAYSAPHPSWKWQ